MRISEKQWLANQRNATRSTGPRSAAGKARAALNALSHGITARTLLAPGEDPAALAEMRDGLFALWRPEGAGEALLMEEIVACTWFVRRAVATETAAMRQAWARRQQLVAAGAMGSASGDDAVEDHAGQAFVMADVDGFLTMRLPRYVMAVVHRRDRGIALLEARQAERRATEAGDPDEAVKTTIDVRPQAVDVGLQNEAIRLQDRAWQDSEPSRGATAPATSSDTGMDVGLTAQSTMEAPRASDSMETATDVVVEDQVAPTPEAAIGDTDTRGTTAGTIATDEFCETNPRPAVLAPAVGEG